MKTIRRELIEFGCEGCGGYFTINLGTSVKGTFLVVCPGCGREHPRVVSDGASGPSVGDRVYHRGVGRRLARTERAKDKLMVPGAAFSTTSRLAEIETPGNLSMLLSRGPNALDRMVEAGKLPVMEAWRRYWRRK